MAKTSIVIPNWNGADDLADCLDSLLKQTLQADIIVVDNGSTDNSLKLLAERYPQVEVITHNKNLGFTGGVNAGMKRALEKGVDYIALFNNDAVADKDWLKTLAQFLDQNPKAGIVVSKLLTRDGERIDSTGEMYTVWGLAYPRGRGEPSSDRYDNDRWVFGASGGACLYRSKALKQIGLYDKDFFAYYDDVDISFRAQLAGWKVAYEPKSIAYHQISGTGGKIKGFMTYQTMKNLPWLLWKNVPGFLLPKVLPRFTLAYMGFYLSAVARGQFWPATKGLLISYALLPKKFVQRYFIQRKRRVSADYLKSIIAGGLPPDAHRLRKLRSIWWKLRGKNA